MAIMSSWSVITVVRVHFPRIFFAYRFDSDLPFSLIIILAVSHIDIQWILYVISIFNGFGFISSIKY
jgi:hypothetical protein